NERWQAVVDKDKTFDGAFVYAVKTTGIFCRPVCKARLARRSNVDFYDSASNAVEAGFRACKRCQPQLAAFDPTAGSIAKVCSILQSLPPDSPSPRLESLAKQAGLTKHHFHRLFKRETGLTPREYALSCR
ncbi:hypothetical protein BAUCODRAFT_44242, partial [Baudoinia panamericana UAMH 10762]